MAFVNRLVELALIEQLAQAAIAGRPERHLAFVGVRRIGKSRIVERYRDQAPPLAVAHVGIDSAAATIPQFLREMVRATVNGVARRNGGAPLDKTAADPAVLALALRLNPQLGEHVARAQTATAVRRPDNHALFVMALTFPQTIAAALEQPFLVLADEFQHIVALATYAPFGGGSRRRTEEAQEHLLGTIRAHIERPLHVGWVATGSSVRLLQHILGHGPLMGRFDVKAVGPFDAADTQRLAELVWEEERVVASPRAVDRVERLTRGHPFNADVTCREAAHTARRLEQTVSPAMVDAAFVAAVFQPQGQINIACKEMYDSLASRAPGLRGFVDALAVLDEPARLSDIGDRLGITGMASLYNYAHDLAWMGIVEDVEPGRYRFTDPIFRYWVARANDPEARQPAAFAPDAVRRLARTFEEAYSRERSMHGHLSEGFLRDLCRSFKGQRLDGARFGRPGVFTRVPVVDDVTTVEATDPTGATLGKTEPTRVQLDLCFGTDELWLGEVKRTTDRATAGDIATLVRKAAFLRKALSLPPGPAWFISYYGFEQAAVQVARTNDMYTSTMQDLQAIRDAIARRQQRA
ncbi:MAG: hypothetical protein HY690_03800 [Chloroflexi bacterium]|nr:hypothetical protein [Chloroflexota bacterium]